LDVGRVYPDYGLFHVFFLNNLSIFFRYFSSLVSLYIHS
jgi:hypothetical protein